MRFTFQDSLYKEIFVDSVPPEPDELREDVVLFGLPSGWINLTAFAYNADEILATTSLSFMLESSDLLPKSYVFAAPNPARDEVIIYFTPGEAVTAKLRVFTIDGQPVEDLPEIPAVGGRRSEDFILDVSYWPPGLYLFWLQVTSQSGSRATVKKPFAVIR